MKVLVRETKLHAVGMRNSTSNREKADRWFFFIARAEASGRATPVMESVSLIGTDWLIECDDAEHAEWLCGWLIE